MPERWTWRVAELPYQYAVEIRGDQAVWIWDSGPGVPPTEEAQPLQVLLAQGRSAVPSAWQQIPPPVLDQVLARGAHLSGAAGLSGGAAAPAGVQPTGPTQFAPAVTAQVASAPHGSNPQGASPQSADPQASNPQGKAPAAPSGWGPPPGAAPQAGFGPPQGPPPASAPVGPGLGSSAALADGPQVPGAGAPAAAPGELPTSASLPTAQPVSAAPAGDPKAQVLALLRAGEKARAVELYRQHFKVSAMLAKEEVEYLAQTLKDE